ncbi:hypothetical protein SMU74_05783 [Streptococcus mutans M2A]|nr:hypothetical protein SMU74_05783 [Streptococcus mutans M2A]
MEESLKLPFLIVKNEKAKEVASNLIIIESRGKAKLSKICQKESKQKVFRFPNRTSYLVILTSYPKS